MIEMAFVLPILIMFIYGIFMVGVMFKANSSMQHALGEGARFATIFPAPTDAQIQTRMQTKLVAPNVGSFGTPAVTTPATADCTNCRQLQITYTVTPDFLFFSRPAVTITRNKRVYLAT